VAIASGRTLPLGIGSRRCDHQLAQPEARCSPARLAVEVSAYLAAVYLTRDCERHHEQDLRACYFQRTRRWSWGSITGDSQPSRASASFSAGTHRCIFSGLTHPRPPARLASIRVRRPVARPVAATALCCSSCTGALAVVAVLWAWGVAQYPRCPGRSCDGQRRRRPGPESAFPCRDALISARQS